MYSCHIIGKKWKNKDDNVYHSVSIKVNGNHIYVPKTFGYDGMYRRTAYDALHDNGYELGSYNDFKSLFEKGDNRYTDKNYYVDTKEKL